MERAKVALLGVIALLLAVQTARDWLPEARAASGDVICQAWYSPEISGNPDKSVAAALASTAPIRDWLVQHPGEPLLHWTVTNPKPGEPNVQVNVLCVRSP